MGVGKKQTIGHKYGTGMHKVLCRQLDALLAIDLAEKPAWRGLLRSGRGSINKPELFGGNKREGGFSGLFDLLDGNTSQGVNDYLASQLGALTSAYRGVVSLVWRRPYIGANSARLPNMSYKLFNAAGIARGWKLDKALIGAEMGGGGASIYIAMDTSLSMTGTRLTTQKTALAGFIRSLKGTVNSVRIVAFSGVINGSIERSDCTDDDYEDIALWLEAYTTLSLGGDWAGAVASASTFFGSDRSLRRSLGDGSLLDGVALSLPGTSIVGSIGGQARSEERRKVVIFTSDGVPDIASVPAAVAALEAISGVEVYAFNIDLADTTYTSQIDNTDSDGVPVISGSDPDALQMAFTSALLTWADMNPAHIIRCLWVDPMRGGIAEESEIGDSFAIEADRFYAEKFGLSPRFRGADQVEEDRLDVERHVDAISYRSRRTGKIELKAIRNDYNPEDLPVLDSSIVLEWAGLDRVMRSETPNQLTVVYTKRENGESASVTRTNTAGVRRVSPPRVIPSEPVEYFAITTSDLATRVCLRDLSVQDRPLLAGQIRLAYLPPELEIGEPFIINEPLLGIENVVVRVMESQEGDGRDNSVYVKISEDRYALPPSEVMGTPAAPPAAATPRAEPSPYRVVQEAPYYLMVFDQTQEDVDNALATDPDLGVLLATGTRPTPSHRNITVAVDAGADYESADDVEFVTSVLTLTALTSEADDVVVTVPLSSDLSAVTANSLALIGTELVRIDAMAENAGNIDLTIGRACLDTAPVEHAIGSRVVFLQTADPRETQYVASESIDVKLLTNLTGDTLTLPAAPVDTVVFASRAIRPYPPGQFKLNGSYVQNQYTDDVVLTWVHRDRTMQTTPVPEDHDDASIGPEAGTTYRIVVDALDATDAVLSTVTDVNVGGVATYDWNDATVLPSGTVRVRFAIASVRGGYESWQRPTLHTILLQPPGNLTAEVL
jgi:hypothetical protein